MRRADEPVELVPFVELGLGHADTLNVLEPPVLDPALERAVVVARRAGGVELERTLGFTRVRRTNKGQ